MKERIEFIDGHRGLAILLVLGYHAYARWGEILPYGDSYADILVFNTGWLGVQLFFLISGFVILLTLEKCSSISEFIFRRWLRLFPGMLICSILIYLTASFFHERPAGLPSFGSLFPPLTFTEEAWWRLSFGFPESPLEGAFWSLYVEFKFYVFAAVIYFWKGERALIYALVGAFSLSILIHFLNLNYSNETLKILERIMLELSFKYFGWFAAGSALYLFYKSGNYRWFYFALFIALICSVFVKWMLWKPALVAFCITLLFAYSIISKNLQTILRQRILLWFGFISYPLYLMHENSMISMIIKLGNSDIGIPFYLLPILPVFILSITAYLIAKYGEVFIRKHIKTLLRNIFPKRLTATTG